MIHCPPREVRTSGAGTLTTAAQTSPEEEGVSDSSILLQPRTLRQRQGKRHTGIRKGRRMGEEDMAGQGRKARRPWLWYLEAICHLSFNKSQQHLSLDITLTKPFLERTLNSFLLKENKQTKNLFPYLNDVEDHIFVEAV